MAARLGEVAHGAREPAWHAILPASSNDRNPKRTWREGRGWRHAAIISEVEGALAAPEVSQRVPRGPDEAIGAFIAATRVLLDGGSVDDALRDAVRGAAVLVGADLAVVRLRMDDRSLVARAVHGWRASLETELAGSRLDVDAVGNDEFVFTTRNGAVVPPAVRRAAVRADADVAWVIPVLADGDVRATLELFRRGPAFSDDEQGLGRLAAAHVGAVIELAGALGEADANARRARVSLDLIADALAAGSEESEVADQVVRVAIDATGAAGAILWRVEPEGLPSFLAAHGFEDLPDLRATSELVQRAVEERGVAAPSFPADAPDPAPGTTILPLGEPPVGALQLFVDGAHPSTDALAAFAARAAVALRRTRRSRLVENALKRSQTIVAVVSQAIAHLSLSHTLETAVDRISELTNSAHVAIYLREGERLAAAAARGLEGAHAELAERLLELALGPYRSRGFLFIADMPRDPRLTGLEPVLEQTGVRRALVVPLVVREEVIGALAVYKTRSRPYRAGEEGLLLALSSQLAVAVQNARLHERTKELGSVLERALDSERKSARQLRGLWEISHSFARSLSLEATLDAVTKTMVELFGIDAAAIRMPDERGVELRTRAIYVADEKIRAAAETILARPQPIDAPFARRLRESGAPILLTAEDAATLPADELLGPFLVKGSTAVILPLGAPGEALGTLTLLSLDPTRPLDRESVEAAMTISAQTALAIDNARLYQQQKDFAETMQRSLIPDALPAVEGLEVGAVYESSARVDVGGDVYDFLSVDERRLAVVLGDVAGKGIGAAADMAMTKYAFRALARLHPEPSDFLARVNDIVAEEVALGKFVTLVYALIDAEAGFVACASAGHPPARVVHPDGKVEEATARGLALGIEPGQEYPGEVLDLESGATVVLHTDGVIEARRDGELYGEGRLDAFLAEHANLPAQELAEALLDDCRAYSGGDIGDDCAIVCLRLAR